MKKLLAILLAIPLFVLAGCDESNSNETNNTSNEESTEVSPSIPGELPEESVVLPSIPGELPEESIVLPSIPGELPEESIVLPSIPSDEPSELPEESIVLPSIPSDEPSEFPEESEVSPSIPSDEPSDIDPSTPSVPSEVNPSTSNAPSDKLSISKTEALEYIDLYLIKNYTNDDATNHTMTGTGIQDNNNMYITYVRDGEKLYVTQSTYGGTDDNPYTGIQTSYYEYKDGESTEYYEIVKNYADGTKETDKGIAYSFGYNYSYLLPRLMAMYSLALVDSSTDAELELDSEFECEEFEAYMENDIITIDFVRTAYPENYPDASATSYTTIIINTINNDVTLDYTLTQRVSDQERTMSYALDLSIGGSVTMPNPDDYTEEVIIPNQQLDRELVLKNLDYFLDTYQASDSCYTMVINGNQMGLDLKNEIIKDNNKVYIFGDTYGSNGDREFTGKIYEYVEYNNTSGYYESYVTEDLTYSDGSTELNKYYSEDTSSYLFSYPTQMLMMALTRLDDDPITFVIDNSIEFDTLNAYIDDNIMTIEFTVLNDDMGIASECTMIIDTTTDEVTMNFTLFAMIGDQSEKMLTYDVTFNMGGSVTMPDKSEYTD